MFRYSLAVGKTRFPRPVASRSASSGSRFPKEIEFIRQTDAGLDARHHDLVTAPLLTLSALEARLCDFPQRSLLGLVRNLGDERVYFNANTPSSGVICGVQGSGKSHTVSCILENALLSDERIGSLPQPLAALVLHFDEQDGNRPCEAAFLSVPSRHLKKGRCVQRVKVLVSASNLASRRRAYEGLPNVDVQPLFLSELDLTAGRMLALMGWNDSTDIMPLYLHVVMQTIREIGVERFSYGGFREHLARQYFDSSQKSMLAHRLNLLDGFVNAPKASLTQVFEPGTIVIVDLTDPFIDATTASGLFDVVLGSFVNWGDTTGKIVVLEEAHKYLTSASTSRLNRSVASIIRQQRHLATRVVIATQEPTVVPATILDLASFVICHRFTSPSWCSYLARHVSSGNQSWFADVMQLRTGEAVVFSANSLVSRPGSSGPMPLGTGHLTVHVRPRLIANGGASILAVGPDTNLGVPAKLSLPTSSTPPPSIAKVQPNLHHSPSQHKKSKNGKLALTASATDVKTTLGSSKLPSPLQVRSSHQKHPGDLSKFEPLLQILKRHSVERVSLSSIAGYSSLQHLRGSKKWLQDYVLAAAKVGVVETGTDPSGKQHWVRALDD